MRNYLIVDDNLAFAENLAEILRDRGDEAVVVTSGSQAIGLVREKRFDVLVTDMKMPGMNGAQLVQEIRRLDPGLAAIVVTAYTGEDDLTGAKQEGILAVLPKPLPIEQIMSLLTVSRRDGLVALVEDDVGLSENLAEALREKGFTTITARSMEEAERLRGIRPFVALVDLRIPGSPRGEVLTQLSERFRSLPLLVITGFPEMPMPIKPMKVFQKPFETTHLLQTLEQLYQPPSRAPHPDARSPGTQTQPSSGVNA